MKEVKLQEICHIEKGKQIDTSQLRTDSPYKYINGGIKESGYYHEYNTDSEAVLVSEGGASCGYVNYVNEKFWCGCHCYKLTESKTLAKYLYYALKGNQDKIMELRSGAAMPNIKKEVFKNMSLLVDFDKNNQQAIVETLECIQKAINNKTDELSSLDELVKSRFIEMFGNIDNTKYPTYIIDDLCEFVRDGTHQTPTYTNDNINGFKFLSSKDVTTGKIDWSNIKYIPPELHEKLYKVISPQKGDILLAKNGTTGTAALVDVDDVFDIYVSLALLRFKKGNNELYLLHAINSDDTKKQFNESLVGVGVPNLHLGKIKKVKLIIPPIELQNEFAEFVKLIDKSKFIVQQQIKDLQELLDSKMDEYFR